MPLTFFQFILNGLLRRKLRTGVTIAGVAVAVAAVYSLLSFQRTYADGLRDDLDRLGAHLLVAPKGCPYDAASLALHGASWPCYLKSSYLQTVARTPHVAVAAPVLMSALYLPDGAESVYCGVLPNIARLKRNWRISGHMCAASGELLVGSEGARLHGWRVGQTVALPGLPHRSGTISGILATTDSADDLFVYLPLADAQALFGRPGELTHILVRLDQPESVDSVVAELRGCDAGLEMNIVPLSHLFHGIQNLIDSTRLLLWCVALSAVMGAGAGLANTVLMAVSERTGEIGVLRAVGGSQTQVFGLVWWETTAVCVMGGVLGIALSLAGAGILDAYLRGSLPFAPRGMLIRPDAAEMAACLAGAILVGGLASLPPALRAARLSPALSLRASGADL